MNTFNMSAKSVNKYKNFSLLKLEFKECTKIYLLNAKNIHVQNTINNKLSKIIWLTIMNVVIKFINVH